MHLPPIAETCRPQSGGRERAADSSIRSIGAHPPGPGKAAGVRKHGVFTLLLAAALALLCACSQAPTEQALRATVGAMQAAAEARDSDALVESVSEDFAGPDGMDRDGFRRYLAVIWLRNREVGVSLGPLEVELIGERATVEFTAAATGGEGWMPDRGQVYRVVTGWRIEGGQWRLISAHWEPAL
jgi:ketosteroid isomerase-like protein